MKVTFVGHSKTIITNELKEKLYNTVVKLIEQGANEFYCGGYGKFDMLCAETVKELKTKYPNIKSYLYLAFNDENTHNKLKATNADKLYDGYIYPDIETVPLKFAISKRNEKMIDASDVVIAYVQHTFGGAYKSLRYAKQRKKIIVCL